MKYRPDIDGLRAIAVLPVLFFHAGFPFFSGGYVGVDIFFVISGYLITSIIIQEKSAGRFTLAGFYERRIRRILPALFTVMAFCLPLAWLFMSPDQMRDFAKSLIAVPLFASNILFWKESDYFAPAAEEKPLLHTWSLAVEEQFYIFFPLFIMLAWPLGKRWMVGIIALGTCLSLGLSEWGWRNQAEANFYLMPTRAWELFMGSLCAFFLASQNKIAVPHGFKQVLTCLGLVLIGISVFAFDSQTPFPSLYTLIPVLGTVFIILFLESKTWVYKILSLKVFVWTGLLSYSLYLWHQPLFAFTKIAMIERPDMLDYAFLILLSFILSVLSWKFIEQPFRNKECFTRKTVFLFGFVSSLFFIVIGLFGYWYKGFPERYSAEVFNLIEAAQHSPKREACHTRGKEYLTPEKACESLPGEEPRWAVFGDSHGVEIAYALGERLKRQNVKHFTFSSCGPAYGLQSDHFKDCLRWTGDVLSYLERTPSLQNIVIVYRHSAHFFGNNEKTYPRLPNRPPLIHGGDHAEEKREILWDAFMNLVQKIAVEKRNVFVLLPIPEQANTLEKWVLNADHKGRDLDNIEGVSKEYYETRNAYILHKFQNSFFPENVHLTDPADIFCGDEKCFVVRDGMPLYFDDDHPSLQAADLIVQKILKQVQHGS